MACARLIISYARPRWHGRTIGMNKTTSSIAYVLNSLIETCKDGQEGFRSAAERVRSTDCKSLFTELSMQREQFAGELQRIVGDLGEKIDTSGSFSGAVRRAWMDLKAAITSGDEHAILVECERGEDAAVAEYRDVLDHEELPASVRHVIEEQYAVVHASHVRVRDLRDRFES